MLPENKQSISLLRSKPGVIVLATSVSRGSKKLGIEAMVCIQKDLYVWGVVSEKNVVFVTEMLNELHDKYG